jgi:hypothetical protein
MAPMVHWPEVMVSYDAESKTLFSADAFGTFGALGGSLYADEANFDLSESRRYYTNIVGKYGDQVMTLLGKAAALDIQRICPLHGPVWRKNIDRIVDKYVRWATNAPEDNGGRHRLRLRLRRHRERRERAGLQARRARRARGQALRRVPRRTRAIFCPSASARATWSSSPRPTTPGCS